MTHSRVPRRADLLEQLRRANRFAWVIVAFQGLAICVGAVFIDLRFAVAEPLLTTIALGHMAGPYTLELAKHFVSKKKRIDDLREQTRFGQFDKHNLASLFRDALVKLGLPNEGIPVFIVADRSMNAMSMHVGLGAFLKSMNGIYLHRQLLHKMSPEEVQDTIGHELGHYYRYYLIIDRFQILPILLGTILGMLAAQSLGHGLLGYAALMSIPSFMWYISRYPYAVNARAIEYLCDDLGAQTNGVLVSIQSLLKLGREAEMESLILHQAIRSKSGLKLTPKELVEAVYESIPYGQATHEEIEERLQRELKKRSEDKSVSFGGFLHYLWNSESDESAEEELKDHARRIETLHGIPRLDWEAVLPDPEVIRFDNDSMQRLIEFIELYPDSPLFRLPDVTGKTDGVHPPIRSRILYLWYNRDEIEACRKR